MTVRVLKLNNLGDPTGEEPKNFPTVEQACAWCVKDRGRALEWGEEGRFFSLEGMTKIEQEQLAEAAEYPPVRYWIFGMEEDGTDRELEDTDWENHEMWGRAQ